MNTYKIAVLNKNGKITYDTPVAYDVIMFADEAEVTKVMRQIQQL